MTNRKWLDLKCWRKWEGVQLTNSLAELLGIRAVEKENPKKENPEEVISIFTKSACQYTEGKGSILPTARSEAAWFKKMLVSYWLTRMCFAYAKLLMHAWNQAVEALRTEGLYLPQLKLWTPPASVRAP